MFDEFLVLFFMKKITMRVIKLKSNPFVFFFLSFCSKWGVLSSVLDCLYAMETLCLLVPVTKISMLPAVLVCLKNIFLWMISV